MNDIFKKLNALAILPHSIGGRLTISSVFDGFRQSGHDVFIFDELKPKDFQTFISDKVFDFIVGYDFSPVKLKSEYNLKMPCIAYFSDVIEDKTSGDGWQKHYNTLKNDDIYTFYWDRALCKANSDIKNLFYMPHFVNCEIYKPLNTDKKYDVMFAGRLDTDYRLNLLESLITDFPNLEIAWFAIEKHYHDALKRAKNPENITKAYKYFIDNENDMALELNRAKIVYNINAQGVSSLNYRTIQTLACGTLLISDYREELDLFDGNIPFYKDYEDLKTKINFYLSDKVAYQSVVNACREIVSQNHNSKNAVNIILQTIKNTPKD